MKEENGIQLYYWIYKQSFMHFRKHSLYCINVLTLENLLNVPYSFYDSMELYAAKYARHYITNCMRREKVLFSINLINPFPAVDKYICFGVFALHARVPEQLVHLSSLCSTYKLCA